MNGKALGLAVRRKDDQLEILKEIRKERLGKLCGRCRSGPGRRERKKDFKTWQCTNPPHESFERWMGSLHCYQQMENWQGECPNFKQRIWAMGVVR
jgi:hypothetical protein